MGGMKLIIDLEVKSYQLRFWQKFQLKMGIGQSAGKRLRQGGENDRLCWKTGG